MAQVLGEDGAELRGPTRKVRAAARSRRAPRLGGDHRRFKMWRKAGASPVGIIAVSRCGGRLAPRWWGSLPFQDAAEGWEPRWWGHCRFKMRRKAGSLARWGSLPFQDATEGWEPRPAGIIAVSKCGGRLGASPGGDHCRFKMPGSPGLTHRRLSCARGAITAAAAANLETAMIPGGAWAAAAANLETAMIPGGAWAAAARILKRQ
jgi:hypothetical protein